MITISTTARKPLLQILLEKWENTTIAIAVSLQLKDTRCPEIIYTLPLSTVYQ